MAVTRGPGNITYYGGGQLGSTVASLARQQMSSYDKNVVPSDSLANILPRLNGGVTPPIIHFWSLDCEGCEDVALESFAWSETQAAVIMLEMVEWSCGGNPKKCEQILSDNGMKRWVASTKNRNWDHIWYSPEYFGKSGRLLPPSPIEDPFQEEMLNLIGIDTAVYNHWFQAIEADKKTFSELLRRAQQ